MVKKVVHSAVKNQWKFVPYLRYEREKLLQCYNSDVSQDWLDGLQILTAWQLRCPSNVPIFVYLTETILKARLNHVVTVADVSLPQWSKDENVRHFDSLVIIRFVNFIYELAQSTCGKLLTVKGAAVQFDIPGWIVELRHAATHSLLMPDNWICRSAVTFLSDWLKTLNDDSTEATKKFSATKRTNAKFSRKIVRALISDPSTFLSIFADILILSKKRMKFHLWDVHSQYPPSVLQKGWHPLLSIVKDQGKMPHLLKIFLLEKFNKLTFDWERVQLQAWIFLFLDKDWLGNFQKCQDWQLIVKKFLRQYSTEMKSVRLLLRIVDCLSPPLQENLRCLANLCDTELLHVEENMVDQLIKCPVLDRSVLETEGEISATDDTKNWLLDVDNAEMWSDLPLGLAPGQKVSDLNFTLDGPQELQPVDWNEPMEMSRDGLAEPTLD